MPITRKTKTKADEEEDFEAEDEETHFAKPRKAASTKANTRARDEDEDDDEEDEDESDLPGIKSGWGGYKAARAESSNFPGQLKLEEDPILVKFLEDEPLATFNQHWIERKGKKSFMCIAPEQECPLCAIGEAIRTQVVFNVLAFTPGGGDPVNNVLQCGVKLSDILQSKSRRKGLTYGYWALSRTGKAGTTNYDVAAVKERDLEEDWDAEPLEAESLEKAAKKKWSPESVVNRQTRKELGDIAKEVVGSYDADDDDDDEG